MDERLTDAINIIRRARTDFQVTDEQIARQVLDVADLPRGKPVQTRAAKATKAKKGHNDAG